jgi:carboxylesterase type B
MLLLFVQQAKYRGKCCFAPVIERGRIEGEETFINESPIDLVTQGRSHKVPYIIGVTSHEGLIMLKGKFGSNIK